DGLPRVKQYTHLLTHQRLHLFFYEAPRQLPPQLDTDGCFPVAPEHWADYAVPKVIEKFLDFLREKHR
ncbi:MAG: hypothetical protein K2O53_01630, partial [Bacteroidales bacterium]|nr:hypothetical protein [Bacteroidales bacterium]